MPRSHFRWYQDFVGFLLPAEFFNDSLCDFPSLLRYMAQQVAEWKLACAHWLMPLVRYKPMEIMDLGTQEGMEEM